MSARLAALDADNARAWHLGHVICSRFTGDAHCVGLVLDRLTADLGPDDFADLVQRLTLMYAELNPLPTTTKE